MIYIYKYIYIRDIWKERVRQKEKVWWQARQKEVVWCEKQERKEEEGRQKEKI